MRICHSKDFVPVKVVSRFLREKTMKPYLEAGVLVSACQGDGLPDYLCVETLETLTKCSRVPPNVRRSAGNALLGSKEKQKPLEDILLQSRFKEVVFYTPKCRIKARTKSDMDSWSPACLFLEGVQRELKMSLPPQKYMHFVRHIYDELGVHPFVDRDGMWHYTVGDIIEMRKLLGLPEIDKSPPEKGIPAINPLTVKMQVYSGNW